MLKCTGTELPHVHGTHCLECAFDFSSNQLESKNISPTTCIRCDTTGHFYTLLIYKPTN